MKLENLSTGQHTHALSVQQYLTNQWGTCSDCVENIR